MAVVSRPRFAALASLLAAAVSADPSPMPNVQVTPWATNCSAFPNQLFAIVGYSPNNADVDNIATQEYDDGSGTIYVTLGKSDKPDIFQCSGMGELQLSSSATSSGHAESIKAVTTGSTLQTGILGVGYNLNASGKPQPLQAVQLTDTDTNTQLTGTFLAAGQAALFVFVQDPVTGQMGISLLASYEDVPDRVTLGFLQVKTV